MASSSSKQSQRITKRGTSQPPEIVSSKESIFSDFDPNDNQWWHSNLFADYKSSRSHVPADEDSKSSLMRTGSHLKQETVSENSGRRTSCLSHSTRQVVLSSNDDHMKQVMLEGSLNSPCGTDFAQESNLAVLVQKTKNNTSSNLSTPAPLVSDRDMHELRKSDALAAFEVQTDVDLSSKDHDLHRAECKSLPKVDAQALVHPGSLSNETGSHSALSSSQIEVALAESMFLAPIGQQPIVKKENDCSQHDCVSCAPEIDTHIRSQGVIYDTTPSDGVCSCDCKVHVAPEKSRDAEVKEKYYLEGRADKRDPLCGSFNSAVEIDTQTPVSSETMNSGVPPLLRSFSSLEAVPGLETSTNFLPENLDTNEYRSRQTSDLENVQLSDVDEPHKKPTYGVRQRASCVGRHLDVGGGDADEQGRRPSRPVVTCLSPRL